MSIDRLPPLDRMMLGVSRAWPQDIGALAILDGGRLLDHRGRLRMDLVREAVGDRLHLVPRFRQVIHQPRRGLGGPLWVDAPTIDLARHVREWPLEPWTGEATLTAAVEDILRRRLDPTRPLWEMWFLSGLPDQRVGLFVRIHHTIADGMAAMATIAAFLDPVPDAPAAAPAPPWECSPPPSKGALLADNVGRRLGAFARALSVLARPRATARRFRAAWPAIRELLAERPATATSLDRMVGPGRKVALIRADLETVKAVGRASRATVNDVLLAVTAGGLRTLLQSRGEAVKGATVRMYVPVSLRPRGRGPQQGNLIAQMAVPVGLDETNSVRRLRQIAGETTERKLRARTNLGTLMVGGGIGRRLLLMAVMRQRVNVTTASITGPGVPLWLAGAPVLEVFPVLPLIANEPLGVGALSYAGALTIGVAADRDAFPDIDVLTAAIREELHALGVPTEPVMPGPVEAAPGLAAGRRPSPATSGSRATADRGRGRRRVAAGPVGRFDRAACRQVRHLT